VGFGCWGAAVGLILVSRRGCVRMVRETEAGVQKGFAVLPVEEIRAQEEEGR
jgi:hypothetical protein